MFHIPKIIKLQLLNINDNTDVFCTIKNIIVCFNDDITITDTVNKEYNCLIRIDGNHEPLINSNINIFLDTIT